MPDASSTLTLADVDLGHDSFAAAVPHEMFAVLRRQDPVHWLPEPDGPGFWAVTRALYGDCAEARAWLKRHGAALHALGGAGEG